MRIWVAALLVITVGCLKSVGEDGGVTPGDLGTRCVSYLGLNQTVCAPVTSVICGGAQCATGEVCCQTTGSCVVAASAACPKLPTTALNSATACATSADCASDEFCMSDDYRRCIGSGHCQSISNCGYCSAPGSDRCSVCGCNGVTYESMQTACVAGISTALAGACGVPVGRDAGPASTIACGTADQCPAGAQCCFRTGKCFDNSEPWRCQLQPDGSVQDCTTHDECATGGSGGGSGNDNLCTGQGCAGPGVCSYRGSTSECGGQVRTVCGCDGNTYVNACWARSAGVRVASDGVCP